MGTAKVTWEALNSEESLEEASGTLTFTAGETAKKLRLKLEQDNVSWLSKILFDETQSLSWLKSINNEMLSSDVCWNNLYFQPGLLGT